MLSSWGVPFDGFDVENEPERRRDLEAFGIARVPATIFDGRVVHGWNPKALAELVGVSGWEIRSRNVIRPGEVWGPGQIMDDGCHGARRCLDAVKPAYDAAVAVEFKAVPPDAYRAGRLAFLEALAGKPRIFLSAWFHDHYDAAARANLARAITRLR